MSKAGLKILQLIDTLDTGGAERMAVNMANAFTDSGILNLLVVSRSKGTLDSLVKDQSSLKLLGKKNTIDFKAFRKLLTLLDQYQPDILHAHGTSVYWGIGAKLLRPKLQLIWHDHLGISEEVIQSNPRKELLWIGSKIDFILTANESTQAYWRSKRLIEEKRIAYLANFPSLSPSEKKLPPVFTFLHLANFRSEKGQLNLMKAAGILMGNGWDFRVRMVGKEVDSAWKNQVLSLRKELHLEERVSVEDSADDVAKLMAEVHAGLVASEREGLPVALLEYGLADLPVISTRVGQCPTVLEEGAFGKLVPAQDSEALALAMKEFLEEPQRAAVLGRSFGRHVEKHFGSSHFLEGYLKIVEEILAFKPGKN
jgi:glycosyltransferase involved in cell wall biosynthesis